MYYKDMKQSIILISCLLITGCGLTLHSDPVKVNPIVVTHNINLNTSVLYSYFYAVCEADNVNGTPEEVKLCTDTKYNDFLSAYTAATGQR